MKKLLISFGNTFLILIAFSFYYPAQAGEIVVKGVGYPPVRAINETQALLMAKRAAVLDAYANAIQRSASYTQENPDTEDIEFYQQISGFVKGMTITSQEYLSDGSVLVVMRGDFSNIEVHPDQQMHRVKNLVWESQK